MMDVYGVIDKIPELPYFFLAMVYIFFNPDQDYVHIFSTAFIFLLAALFMGTALKLIFKTKRPKTYRTIKMFSYGFPSLHSLISIGAISFIYFVDPWVSLIFTPLGILYIHSRIKLGIHTKRDVAGGAIIGLVVGAMVGSFGLGVFLSPKVEFLFSILLFSLPIAVSYLRIKSVL